MLIYDDFLNYGWLSTNSFLSLGTFILVDPFFFSVTGIQVNPFANRYLHCEQVADYHISSGLYGSAGAEIAHVGVIAHEGLHFLGTAYVTRLTFYRHPCILYTMLHASHFTGTLAFYTLCVTRLTAGWHPCILYLHRTLHACVTRIALHIQAIALTQTSSAYNTQA